MVELSCLFGNTVCVLRRHQGTNGGSRTESSACLRNTLDPIGLSLGCPVGTRRYSILPCMQASTRNVRSRHMMQKAGRSTILSTFIHLPGSGPRSVCSCTARVFLCAVPAVVVRGEYFRRPTGNLAFLWPVQDPSHVTHQWQRPSRTRWNRSWPSKDGAPCRVGIAHCVPRSLARLLTNHRGRHAAGLRLSKSSSAIRRPLTFGTPPVFGSYFRSTVHEI